MSKYLIHSRGSPCVSLLELLKELKTLKLQEASRDSEKMPAPPLGHAPHSPSWFSRLDPPRLGSHPAGELCSVIKRSLPLSSTLLY